MVFIRLIGAVLLASVFAFISPAQAEESRLVGDADLAAVRGYADAYADKFSNPLRAEAAQQIATFGQQQIRYRSRYEEIKACYARSAAERKRLAARWKSYRAKCRMRSSRGATSEVCRREYDKLKGAEKAWEAARVTCEANYKQNVKALTAFRSSVQALHAKLKRDLRPVSLPAFERKLGRGGNPVKITNPNAFSVRVGLRAGNKGRDFAVRPRASTTVSVPHGAYRIYFVFSSQPKALLRGDDFSVRSEYAHIQLVQVANGNYAIRAVN